MSDNDRAKLDYYTKNMTTHATIIVAVVFGLFSILGIASGQKGEPFWAISIVYGILVLLGLYEIYRLKFYGSEAKKLSEDKFEIRNLPEDKDQSQLERKINSVVRIIFESGLVYICFLIFVVFSFLSIYLDISVGLPSLRRTSQLQTQLVGSALQTIGILIILISQVAFWFRTRKEWGSFEKAVLDITSCRVAIDDEKLRQMSKTELKEALKKFPFAKFLYDDFRISVVGLLCSLIGTLLLFV